MQIKHSKYKNTGLIFELLVKQVAADTLSKKDSPAIKILKTHYTSSSALSKEFKLYEVVTKSKGISQNKAEAIISTIVEISRKLDTKELKKAKYELVKSIKESYNIDDFFSIKVRDYKALASTYCLLEAHIVNDLVDPNFIIENKTTLLEYLTESPQDPKNTKNNLIEEYSKYDKDLKLLTYKILLEKFNEKYTNLLPEQKNILKQFIVSVSSNTRLRSLVNEEYTSIAKAVTTLSKKVKDDVSKIKLKEVVKGINMVDNKEKITDTHLVNIMQYYELIKELKTL